MRGAKRIVFWQTVPSPHQSAFMAALQRRPDTAETLCVFERTLDQERLDMGWSLPDFGLAKVIIAPSSAMLLELFDDVVRDSVSIVSGIADRAWSRGVLNALIRRGGKVGLLSEGRDYRGLVGALRVLHGQFVERQFRRKADFVLTMGQRGFNWYRLCGYPASGIYSFPYVVEPVEHLRLRTEEADRPFRIIVVARLIPLKNINMLIDVLARLRGEPWVCTIIGDGTERQRLSTLTARHRLEGQISFHGTMPNAAARERIATADLLVLPSIRDGWGAVVNEALMEGTPVLVSDYCGAAELIQPGFNGELFVNRSAQSLEGGLRNCIERGKVGPDKRRRLKEWSKSIQGDAVAAYLAEILGHVYEGMPAGKPLPPWASVPR